MISDSFTLEVHLDEMNAAIEKQQRELENLKKG